MSQSLGPFPNPVTRGVGKSTGDRSGTVTSKESDYTSLGRFVRLLFCVATRVTQLIRRGPFSTLSAEPALYWRIRLGPVCPSLWMDRVSDRWLTED